MKPILKHVAAAGIFAASLANQASALLIPITENIRPVEKTEEVSPGVFVKVINVTVVEGTENEPIIKTMKQYFLPAEGGVGTVKYLLEIITTVVPNQAGKLVVTTTTNTTTTPIGPDGTPTGEPTTVEGSPNSTVEEPEDVVIPIETVIDPEPKGPLDVPSPISGK